MQGYIFCKKIVTFILICGILFVLAGKETHHGIQEEHRRYIGPRRHRRKYDAAGDRFIARRKKQDPDGKPDADESCPAGIRQITEVTFVGQEYPYLMWYFHNMLGYCPEESEWLPTRASIAYMLDNDLPGEMIVEELRRHHTASIHPNDLSEHLWDGSLLQKGHFYFHKELQIVSPAPILKKDGTVSYREDYLEMRIRYTEQDILDYFYTRIRPQDRSICDSKKDSKAVAYILKRFSNIENVEPVDLFLCLIDDFTNNVENTINDGVIDVLKSLSNVLPWYQADAKNAAAGGKNIPRWHYGV